MTGTPLDLHVDPEIRTHLHLGACATEFPGPLGSSPSPETLAVVDLGRCVPPLSVGPAPAGPQYVFNRAQQVIAFPGLVCLMDAQGPCANGVKDSQRTKTDDGTTRTLSLVWGPASLAAHVDAAVAWYRELLREAGARSAPVALRP